MTIVLIEHICTDEKGVARIAGCRSKVSQIIVDIQAGLSPAQIHAEYPHLSLGQIHAALSYYYDHPAEIEAEIEASLRADDALRADPSSTFDKTELLKRAKKLIDRK